MAYAGVDCATKLTDITAKALKDAGKTHVGRYLNPGWKGLSVSEVQAISDAGLEIISIFEDDPRKVSYFTEAQGKLDAINAVSYAKSLGQPAGTAIYFTVDFDANGKDLQAVLTYFNAVIDNVEDYKVGAYGSYGVLNFLGQQSKIEYYYQTIAWSHGLINTGANIYQNEENVLVGGIQVDNDQINKDPGSWMVETIQPTQSAPPQPVVQTSKPVKRKLKQSYEQYTIEKDDTLSGIAIKYDTTADNLATINNIKDPDVIYPGDKIKVPIKVEHKTSSHPKKDTYVIKSGDTFWSIENKFSLAHGTLQHLNPQIKDPTTIQPGQVINLPDAVKHHAKATHVHVNVEKDDNLSTIAADHGLSLAEIEKLNPQVKAPNYVIYPGQRIRIK